MAGLMRLQKRSSMLADQKKCEHRLRDDLIVVTGFSSVKLTNQPIIAAVQTRCKTTIVLVLKMIAM